MLIKEPKTELDHAWNKLIMAIICNLKIDKFVEWLAKKLKGE